MYNYAIANETFTCIQPINNMQKQFKKNILYTLNKKKFGFYQIDNDFFYRSANDEKFRFLFNLPAPLFINRNDFMTKFPIDDIYIICSTKIEAIKFYDLLYNNQYNRFYSINDIPFNQFWLNQETAYRMSYEEEDTCYIKCLESFFLDDATGNTIGIYFKTLEEMINV